MLEIVEKEKCVGCAACSDVCGRKAIEMQTDGEGFAYPRVIQEKCTDCGQCKSICPILNNPLSITQFSKDFYLKIPTVYAARHKNKEIILASTSGGLFSALAEYAYSKNMAVGGSVFTEDLHAKHFISDDIKDLDILRTSKYQQSSMDGFYRQAKEYIKQGKKCLLVGMPCQIAALQNYFKNDLNNIIFVDTICAGVNSPMVFQKFLRSLEQEYEGKIVKFRAKAKDWGWRALAQKIEFDNGKMYHKFQSEDDWVRGLNNVHAFVRPCCHNCRFRSFPRSADITLGDFWGIEKLNSKIDDNSGTSVVLINSQKGKDFFENCKETVEIEEYSLRDAISGNGHLFVSSPKFPQREAFFEYLKTHTFAESAQKFFPYNENKRTFLSKLAKVTKWIIKNFWNVKFRYSKPFKKQIFIGDSNCALDIHRTAKIELQGIFKFGYKRNRKSKLESALLLEKNSEFDIGKNVTVYYGADFQVFKNAKLSIGANTGFNRNVQIICMEQIEIGNNCLVARDVVIRDNDGGHKILADGYKTTNPIKIGNNVWIGHGAMIMKGVTIGDGAVISAGAWVVGNVKPNTVVMGDPARTVQKEVIWVY